MFEERLGEFLSKFERIMEILGLFLWFCSFVQVDSFLKLFFTQKSSLDNRRRALNTIWNEYEVDLRQFGVQRLEMTGNNQMMASNSKEVQQ